MKKTLVLISVLAAMAMTFAGCDANIEVNTPGSLVGEKDTAIVTEVNEKDEPTVTEAVKETEVTKETTAPAVSEVTEAVKETAKETETKKESGICEKLAENAANGSPLAKGYKASGYSDMMDRYYNVSYTDDGYTYSLNRESVMLGTANFLLGSEGTVVSASSENISAEDEKNFERLLEYVNGKAGEGNYKIHDAFTEEFEDAFGIPGQEKERVSSGKVTHIEIVLNSDLDKYTAAADADKAKFTVKFEVADDGDIRSEYEYYGKTKELRKDLLNELNALSSDYAYGIDQCTYDDYDGVLTEVHTPFFSADRKSVVNGEEAEFWLNKGRRSTAVSESKGDADKTTTSVYLSIYCKPGTDTSSLVSVLEELYPVTSKYGVTYVNIDVLENESDFERYRNCDGIIPEETIKSAHRECHFNNPEFGWGVPGK